MVNGSGVQSSIKTIKHPRSLIDPSAHTAEADISANSSGNAKSVREALMLWSNRLQGWLNGGSGARTLRRGAAANVPVCDT